jgi:protein SCO1/2
MAFLLLTLLLTACTPNSTTKLPGTDLGGAPAADFRLTDAQGNSVALSDYRGKPVVLTFLYTNCPDVCPLIGQRIGQAVKQLGGDAGKVAVLAVSVDPDGDTPAAAAAFMSRYGLTGPGQHYLLGDESTLVPVWLAYGISAEPAAQGGGGPGEPAQPGRVGHTDGTILIDRDGHKRSLLRSEATADAIAAGLRILLR